MKFEEMYIEANKEQKPIVCKILEENGFMSKVEMDDICASDDGFISTYASGRYSTYPEALFGTILTFEEFMQRYSKNEMIKKINQAKKELGLNNSELSLRMGKSRPYIAKMLNQPQSEKVQNKVIKEIDELLEFDKLCKAKEYARCASELKIPVSINDLSVQKRQDSEKDKEILDLKKIIESKDLAISGLIKQNDEAKKIHDKDVKALVEKDDQFMVLAESLEQSNRERDYFVNQYKQSELAVNSLKSKIKRERIIILIIIVILTALFFLKGSIGG